MKYIIAILILVFIFCLYGISYVINSKVNKPNCCKDIKCEFCNLNCNKRSDIEGPIH